MDWRLKSAIRRGLLAMPGGARLYRRLTVRVLGTNTGMAAKWFRVFPAHAGVMRQAFGDDARQTRMWCFDSGATIAAGLAMAVATDEPGLLTDRNNRLCDRYDDASLRLLAEKGPALAELTGAPPGRVASLQQALQGRRGSEALQTACMTYAGTHTEADSSAWRGAIGCVFSAGTLEHYTPEELDEEVARMATALRPGGVMSHVVDHRDHRWHADKRVGPLEHLTLEDDEFAHRFGNPLDYHNRWLRSRYVEFLTRHGFRVECQDVIRYTDDLPPLDRSRLAPPFADASDDDLGALVTRFVAVRVR